MPIEVNLQGLLLKTSQIQVNADAITGNGDLLGNVLTTLQDYGLLTGDTRSTKYIVGSKLIAVAIVPAAVFLHLVRLLQAEGVEDEQLGVHPDWQLWLWGMSWVRELAMAMVRERSGESEQTEQQGGSHEKTIRP